MNESNEEHPGLDWLDKMLEWLKSEPVFEAPQWNAVLAELGRITAYFDMAGLRIFREHAARRLPGIHPASVWISRRK
jgi:hypothetical protein